MRHVKKFRTHSSAETKKLGEELARKIAKDGAQKNAKDAVVIGLAGELGSGKTTFIQGFFRGLGVRKKIASPTFVLIKSYKLKTISYKLAHHIDAYRLKKPGELLALGFKEIIKNPENIVLIEWADRMKKLLPESAAKLRFRHGRTENERTIKIKQCKQCREILQL